MVGLQKDFAFNCPSVDASETAYLMFQSYRNDTRAILRINGVDVYGGVPATRSLAWSANILLVEPRHKLKAAGNIMHVESTGSYFTIDNVVIAYKTRLAGDQPPIGSRKSPAKSAKRH